MRFWEFTAAILEAILYVFIVRMYLIYFWNYEYSSCLWYLCQICIVIMHIKLIIIGDVRSKYDFLRFSRIWPWIWPWPWCSINMKMCHLFATLFVNNNHQLNNSNYYCLKFNSNMFYFDHIFQWWRPSWTPSWISQPALTWQS